MTDQELILEGLKAVQRMYQHTHVCYYHHYKDSPVKELCQGEILKIINQVGDWQQECKAMGYELIDDGEKWPMTH